MNRAADSAVTIFNNGFNCSQAVLASHCEELGLDKDSALKLSCAFGGGMGHIGEVCGAVSGALMLLGLRYGKYRIDDAEGKERTYKLVQDFTRQFKAKHGSIQCTDLIGYDISIEEELIRAREAGVFKTVCPLLVKDSVELIEKLL
jgi:C_GCAxxG_C_C family probable redox protein